MRHNYKNATFCRNVRTGTRFYKLMTVRTLLCGLNVGLILNNKRDAL